MLFNYDYTFCDDKSCPHEDCLRHSNRKPIGVPISTADFSIGRDESSCEYFVPEA